MALCEKKSGTRLTKNFSQTHLILLRHLSRVILKDAKVMIGLNFDVVCDLDLERSEYG